MNARKMKELAITAKLEKNPTYYAAVERMKQSITARIVEAASQGLFVFRIDIDTEWRDQSSKLARDAVQLWLIELGFRVYSSGAHKYVAWDTVETNSIV